MATQQGTKRSHDKTVDPDGGEEITSSKKARIEPDIPKKLKCLKFILTSFRGLHSKIMAGIDPDFKNVSIGNQVCSILFTVFNNLRQKANGFDGNAQKKSTAKGSFTVNSKGVSHFVTVAEAQKIVSEAAIACGLEFKKFDDKSKKENWYGTAAPYLDFFAGNALRIIEQRVGHSLMPISKSGDKSTSFPVEKYGINGAHHVLLEGCTFPPEKRSSMAQSLGPLTVLLCHIRSEEKYREKWTKAAKRAMAHVPIIDEILEVVKGKKAVEVRSVIGLLADILLITTARQAHRMFFPLNMLAHIYAKEVDEEGNMMVGGIQIGKIGGDALLSGLNVSGNGGFYFYNLLKGIEWEIEGTLKDTEAGQVVFHAIFGTYKEDLSILEQITDVGTWWTREQIGKGYQKMTTCGKSTLFKLPGLKYYSKLTSANQTGLLATTYSQTCAIPVFSGSRIQHYSDDFFEQLNKRSGHIVAAKTIPQLVAALTDILSELREHLEKNGRRLEMGTVSWSSTENMDLKNGGTPTNKVFEGTGKFFLGKSK